MDANIAESRAKYQKSFRDYTLICRLDSAKGLDVSVQYINDKAGATFVTFIAKVTREYVIEIQNETYTKMYTPF